MLMAAEPAADGPSVTVLPVVITPGENVPPTIRKAIAEVIGMLLERAGLEEVVLADAEFTPPETDDTDQIAAAFGRFVRGQKIATDHALLAELVGTPKTGARQIRTVLVDREGAVVLADLDDPTTFRKTSGLVPKDPVTCSVFVARKVQKLWNLDDPLRKGATGGKLSKRWREKSGLPGEEEMAALKKRLAAMKKKLAGSRVAVYPVRTAAGSDAECARRLAQSITEAGLCTATAVEVDPGLEVKGHYNEQKVLWTAARGFRQFVREHRPTADYALYAEYGGLGAGKVGGVHVILCDSSGDWVLVDYQNSHHPDFQSVNPKSADDCNRLVVRRLKKWTE